MSYCSTFLQYSVESSLHLSIPYTVDEGVEQWVEDSVKQEKDLQLLLSLTIARDHINHHGDAKLEPNNTEVEGAGGRGFLAALL